MTIATAYLRDYITWARRLPQATGMMFAARSRLGRSCKIILFGVGAVLPLGSIIWALLFWHGRYATANRPAPDGRLVTVQLSQS